MISFDGFPIIKFAKPYTGPGRQLGTSANNGGNMKEIMYKGKKVKVPFEDANYNLDGDKDIEIQNPFSGEKATVPGYAAAVYDVIMGAQVTNEYDLVR